MNSSLILLVTIAALFCSHLTEGAKLGKTKVRTVRLSGECNSFDREKTNEGDKKCVYKDSMGHPTIGVGFNLDKFGARSEIESVGADYDKVRNGSECLNDGQIEQLFDKDMDSAVGCADGFCSGIPDTPLSAVADMAFNMGCATLHTFTTFRSLLNDHKYEEAAQDMKSTAWCGQVGYRCDRDVKCVEEGLKSL